MNPQLSLRRITTATIILVSLGLLFFGIRSHVTSAQSQVQTPSDSPVGWRASYTQIYFDDVESLQLTLGSQFLLESAGTLTSTSGEVITGRTATTLSTASDSVRER